MMITNWVLVSLVVVCTVLGDLLQSLEMKRHGEIRDFRPSGLRRHLSALISRKYLALAIFFMAVSFFVFMKLVSVADLSFAVPATAASFVLETILARLVLKERVDIRRWAGAALVAGGVALLAR
jgi:drug/metabolite transporter (DMT)-like permease